MSISGVGGGGQFTRSFQPPSFSSLDKDSSGGVSLDELEAGAPGGASDSKSTGRAKQLFSQMDAHSDGSVSSDEKDAFDNKIESQRKAMQFMAQLLGAGDAQQGQSNDDVFSATDSNGDGSVSLDEFSGRASSTGLSTDDLSQLFDLIDSDSSGSISDSESSDFLDGLKQEVSQRQGPPPGPPPGGGPNGPPPEDQTANDSESTSSATLDLLSVALSSYGKSNQQTDLLTSIASLLQKAA